MLRFESYFNCILFPMAGEYCNHQQKMCAGMTKRRKLFWIAVTRQPFKNKVWIVGTTAIPNSFYSFVVYCPLNHSADSKDLKSILIRLFSIISLQHFSLYSQNRHKAKAHCNWKIVSFVCWRFMHDMKTSSEQKAVHIFSKLNFQLFSSGKKRSRWEA